MTTVSIGKARYDIITDTTSFVKGSRASRAEIKSMDTAFRNHAKASEKTAHQLERLAAAEAKAGGVTRATANERRRLTAQRRAELAVEKEIEQAAKKLGLSEKQLAAIYANETKSVKELRKQLALLTGEKDKSTRRNGFLSNPNVAGSFASMFGLGGAGAGFARTFAHMGEGGVVGGSTLAAILSATNAYAKLEKQIVDIQVIMGDKSKGQRLVNDLRAIAKVTPLTTSSLIKATQTMLGYGLESKNMTEIVKRLGEVSGGNAEKMQALTVAFSQISAQGKLMGQELLQLVNAGFPVAEIAKAAGVEMKDFRKEMEKGTIKAHHFVKALVAMTSEGGLMEGRLAEQAKTISGAYTIAFAEIEEAWVALGKKLSEKIDLAESIKFGGKTIAEFIGGFGEVIGTAGEAGGGVMNAIARQISKEMGAQVNVFQDVESVQQGLGRFLNIVADRVESYIGGGAVHPITGERMGFRTRYFEEQIVMSKRLESFQARLNQANESQALIDAEKQEREKNAAEKAARDAKNAADHADAKRQYEYEMMRLSGDAAEAERMQHRDKMSRLAEENQWTEQQYRQRMQWHDELAAARKAQEQQELEQEQRKSDNKKKIDDAADRRDEQIAKVRDDARLAREKLMAKKVLSHVAGVDASGAGQDYAFVAKRQAAREQFIAQKKLDEERNKKLAEIKAATERREKQINATFKTLADNLNSIGD